MKKLVLTISILSTFLLNHHVIASEKEKCTAVYTIGDTGYSKAIENGHSPVKLGPISTDRVSNAFPQSFLEDDGSYGGGVVFCSIKEALQGLNRLLEDKIIPNQIEWHIYELDATWETDVYQLRQNDFRLNKNAKVTRLVD